MLRRLVMSSAVAALLVTAVSGPAIAGGPHSTGIDTSTEEGEGSNPGYTSTYAQWKEHAASPSALVATGPGIEPDSPEPPGPGYPSAHALSFTIYHQKTGWWCMPAVGQSIAHHRWGGFNTPSIEAKQADIASAMGTTSNGTTPAKSLAWMNERFANHDEDWRYVGYRSSSLAVFTSHAMYDTYVGNLPMYVRVDLNSNHYKWFDSTPGTVHATLLTGWSEDGAKARSADPYARPKSGGGCTITWDSGQGDFGCVWGTGGGFTMLDYYLARDPGNGNPEWY